MPCNASLRASAASSGLSTSTPTSVFHKPERGSKLNEPIKDFCWSKIIALLCRLESELIPGLNQCGPLPPLLPGWRRSSKSLTPCSSSALRYGA